MMATDTVPAAVPMPPEPPNGTPATTPDNTPTRGFLTSMVAAVEPARPTTFDLTPTNAATTTDPADGVIDRSAPGLSSASFRDTQDAATDDASGAKRKAQGSVWKAWLLAGAQRWAKGGGSANKRLDMHKARAQAHQVKEARTTTVNKSGGIPLRNSSGGAGGGKHIEKKAAPNNSGKGQVNSSGNRSGGAGAGGSGGGAGRHSAAQKTPAARQQPSDKKQPAAKEQSPAKNNGHQGPGHRGPGKGAPGPGGHAGTAGKDSRASGGKTSGHDTKNKTNTDKTPSKTPPNHPAGTGAGKDGAGKQGPSGKTGATGKDGHTPNHTKAALQDKNKPGHPHDTRTPLEKSRETGHKDGRTARQVIDHVKAYTDGARDGYRDQRAHNAKDHARLDKAHADHAKNGRPQAATDKEDDGVSTDIKPLTVKQIDANTLTLGTDATRPTVGRRELRNFKQYERKLEDKATILHKIAEACTQLEKEAENEARACQTLAEQAKNVEGGDKLLATLNRLAEAAKNQATEAGELTKRAQRAAELCKAVLTNIQTRYAPLYKAVVDSDETKPAELRFYNDKGVYATAA